MNNSPIVTAKWLNEHRNDENLVIIDASQESNVSGLVPEYTGIYIPGAITLNLKTDFSDAGNSLPNTLLQPDAFQEQARRLGINGNSKIVVYDNLGVYFGPRVWWMFKTMGHNEIYVLNGGLSGWVKESYEVVEEPKLNLSEGNFTSNFKSEWVYGLDDVLNNLETKKALVIDARSRERFGGSKPEPREGIRSGHIPNSKNIPFKEVLQNGYFKTEGELRTIFNEIVKNDGPLVYSCGSGLTACITMMAGLLINPNPAAVYDGSWTEWGQTDYPLEKGS